LAVQGGRTIAERKDLHLAGRVPRPSVLRIRVLTSLFSCSLAPDTVYPAPIPWWVADLDLLKTNRRKGQAQKIDGATGV